MALKPRGENFQPVSPLYVREGWVSRSYKRDATCIISLQNLSTHPILPLVELPLSTSKEGWGRCFDQLKCLMGCLLGIWHWNRGLRTFNPLALSMLERVGWVDHIKEMQPVLFNFRIYLLTPFSLWSNSPSLKIKRGEVRASISAVAQWVAFWKYGIETAGWELSTR